MSDPGNSYPSVTREKFGIKLELNRYPEGLGGLIFFYVSGYPTGPNFLKSGKNKKKSFHFFSPPDPNFWQNYEKI